MILLATVSVPHLRAAGDAPPADSKEPTKQSVTKDQPGPQAAAAEPAAKEGKEFELRLVGPGGQPIPKALVEPCSSPALTAQQVRQGAFVRQESYAAIVATDAEGRLVVEPPNKSDYLNVYITIPDYGPYWAGWTSVSHAEPVPPRFTAELEAAWSVGGIVVDGEGKAVAGAHVSPIDDVPAGDYSLRVQFQRDEAGQLHNHRFKVPSPEGELAGQPVDLGILRLEKR